MLNRIKADIKQAMLDHDDLTKNTLRMVQSNAQLEAKEKKTEVTDQIVLNAITKELKQTNQAIEVCKQNGDCESEFYKKNLKRVEILEKYMPKQLSEEELRQEIVKILSAVDKTNKGLVMKTVMPALKGRADGKLINKMVQEVLSKQ